MSKTILKVHYSLTPVPGSDLVEIGVSRASFAKLCLKMTFWGMLPSVLILGSMYGYAEYLEYQDRKNDNKSPNTEN
jgi:hypothetical protein